VSVRSTIVPRYCLGVANIQFQEAKVGHFVDFFEIAGLEVESDQESEENNDFKGRQPTIELDQVKLSAIRGELKILRG